MHHFTIIALEIIIIVVFYIRGYEEIWQNLDMDDVLCYWRRLLLEYAELAQWTVEAIAQYKVV